MIKAEIDKVMMSPLSEAEKIQIAVRHFEILTDMYIQSKIESWNEVNSATGVRFDNILSFPKYAVIPTDSRHDVSVRFLTWNGKVWDAVHAWQGALTAIPTDAEWQVVVDSVIF